MDPFTQRMMERARMRREKLDSEMAAVGQSDIKRRRTPLVEPNPTALSAEDGRGESPSKPVLSSAIVSSPPKPVIPKAHNEQEDQGSTDENITSLETSSSSLHSKLNRLGKLYSGAENLEDMSSPVHHHTETLSRYTNVTSVQSLQSKVTSSSRKARFAALAHSIEEWEDDLSKLTPSSKVVPAKSAAATSAQPTSGFRCHIGSPVKTKPPANMPTRALVSSPSRPVMLSSPSRSAVAPSPPRPAAGSPPVRPTFGSPTTRNSPGTASSPRGVQMGASALQTKPTSPRVTSVVHKATKTIVWDQAVIATLEAQGFKSTKRRSRLIYRFEDGACSSQEQQAGERKGEQQIPEEDEEEAELSMASPATGSVSSPGWVYKAGSPLRRPDIPLYRGSPRMGLQSPVSTATSRVNTQSPPFKAASPVTAKPSSPLMPRSPLKIPRDQKMSPGSVLQKAAMFESAAANNASPSKDPAELTLVQRMALFEKNKSQGPLLPKVAFATPLPANLVAKTVQEPQAKMVEKKTFPKETSKEHQLNKGAAVAAVTKVLAQKAMFEKSAQQPKAPTPVVAASLSERQQELEMLRHRWDKQKEMAGKPVESAPSQEALQAERMRSRWERETRKPQSEETPPPPPPMPSQQRATKPSNASPTKNFKSPSPTKKYPGLDAKKLRVSPVKEGRLYPSLSDVEMTTESEMDMSSTSERSASDDGNSSFGAEILQAAGLRSDRYSTKRAANEMTASECAVLNEIDEFLDEALGSDSENVSVGPTPPKRSRDLEEASQFRTPAVRELPARAQHPLPSMLAETGQAVPLVHTVSFYRKQQAKGSRLATPVKQVFRQPESESDSEEDSLLDHEHKAVQKKIDELNDQVSKQQTVISQASQALNLCRSTVEFSNSAEQVEAERLLLVATHRRQALLDEIQRLKVEGTLQPQGEHTETGSLTISNLALPLKREFLAKSRRVDDNVEHYIVCLVRCQEHVLVSPMLPTSIVPPQQEVLRFPGTFTLENLSGDFAIRLEVYTLQLRKETISHEDKYHIKKDKDTPKLRLTPKKQKHDSVLVMPVVQSPAGPGAVRSPSFVLVGYTIFSLREINRTHFTLNKVPFSSPLEGHIDMKMACELHLDTQQRGFLSMFEDVSGFGAWHRRWCVLDKARLSFWKYPDDEKNKEPIGWIDLTQSCSKQVTAVPRDVCARLNTFLVETRRPRHPDDRESLVMIPGPHYTTLRHLLSTDTREERLQWCSELSRALSSLRAWRASTGSTGSASSSSASSGAPIATSL